MALLLICVKSKKSYGPLMNNMTRLISPTSQVRRL